MTTARNESLVSRVVGWIREGYPEGVPDHDYVALYGILQRALAPTELDRVVGELMYDADSGDAIVTRPVIAERIADVVEGSGRAGRHRPGVGPAGCRGVAPLGGILGGGHPFRRGA